MSRKEKDKKTLSRFIRIYCSGKHGGKALCNDCEELLGYSLRKLEKCPFNPKPMCKDCRVHCYDKKHRKAIREVMKYSGKRVVLLGSLEKLRHLISWPLLWSKR